MYTADSSSDISLQAVCVWKKSVQAGIRGLYRAAARGGGGYFWARICQLTEGAPPLVEEHYLLLLLLLLWLYL